LYYLILSSIKPSPCIFNILLIAQGTGHGSLKGLLPKSDLNRAASVPSTS
jgi:hypothetical protein